MKGIDLIKAERLRQLEVEGFDAKHDDQWVNGELAQAAACYAGFQNINNEKPEIEIETIWPFHISWWKPSSDRIEELTKAGALIAAEIDRLLRQQKQD